MTTQTRKILVYSPLAHTAAELCDAVRRQGWVKSDMGSSRCRWQGRGLDLRVHRVSTLERVIDRLYTDYFNLVVVDLRNLPHDAADPARQEQALEHFFAALRAEKDSERRYPRRRIVVLVGDEDEERVDRLIFALGRRHIGACIRDLSLSPQRVNSSAHEAQNRFVESLWSFFHQVFVAGRPGKKAINAAGGGITGIYYELGVLKCLHDSIDIDIRDFDLFSGVSGGAVVCGCLANGIELDEMIAKIGAMDSSWQYRLRVGWRHLNVAQVPQRIYFAQRELVKYVLRMVRREDDFSVASLLGIYAALLGPIFDNSQFERALRDLFTMNGRSNDFRELRSTLLVGATDQDRREHVLFGATGWRDVPISEAIQASSAMHPFFPSVKIRDRYFTDGIVTRTSNLKASIDLGADLVFVIDPFVPIVSDRAGYNSRHGNMWVVEQDYKTLAYTRFEQARDQIVRMNPQANIYTFVPSNRMRQLMSNQNPFVARNFHPIVCEAYRSTYRRLRSLEYKIRGELGSHHINLDLAPVEEKVGILRTLPRPDVRVLLNGEWANDRGISAA